jgi:3-oxoacyl-[acyl-carrier protein] reductase
VKGYLTKNSAMKLVRSESSITSLAEHPVALITGGTRGIGAAIALELAKNDFDIAVTARAITDRGTEQAKSIINQLRTLGGKAIFIKGDISSTQDRISLVNSLKREFGRIDVLVNNAGIAPKVRTDILKVTEENFDAILAVNLQGPYFLTQLIAKWMIELKKKRNIANQKIITITSTSSYTSSTQKGDYCISKAGLSMVTKLYADRLAEYGINVYEIRPSIISTAMSEPVKKKYDKLISEGVMPIKRWGTPGDLAKAVVAIAKDYFPFSTGAVFDVDGGFHLRRL